MQECKSATSVVATAKTKLAMTTGRGADDALDGDCDDDKSDAAHFDDSDLSFLIPCYPSAFLFCALHP